MISVLSKTINYCSHVWSIIRATYSFNMFKLHVYICSSSTTVAASAAAAAAAVELLLEAEVEYRKQSFKCFNTL